MTPALLSVIAQRLRNVAPPVANSALSTLASSMSAGTWAELTTNGVSTLGTTGSQGGVGGNMIPYSNQAVWNPVTKCISYCGNDHHGGVPPWTMMEVQYDEASNTWSAVPGLGGGNQIVGMTPSHGYGHNAMRPDTGEFYLRQYGGDGSGHEIIWRKRIGGSWAAELTSPSVYVQVAIGTCWWTGSLSGSQSMGAYIVWQPGFGNILIYDPGLNSWQKLADLYGTDGLYHGVCMYSAVYNCCVFGGGNATPRNLWRLNSDRTITALTNAPIDVGIQRSNFNVDPVSGKFLIFGGGSSAFYELIPTGSGTYNALSGTRLPPAAGLHGVSDPSTGAGSPDALISCALPDHGVVAYMSASSASYANMFLYKHA